MSELKTLKDYYGDENVFIDLDGMNEFKQEAIKWVKEDFELVRNVESHKMLERWKKRFNITEEDLK